MQPLSQRHCGVPLSAMVLGVLLSVSAAAAQVERLPVTATPHFAFYSDLATNLNDALVESGRARAAGEAELFHSGAEQSCFEELAPSLRAGWDRAVDYYAEIISPAAWNERQQFLLRLDLAGLEELLGDDARARQFMGLAASFRDAGRPAYEACRWRQQDAANRRWIGEVVELLDAYEETVAGKLAGLYAVPWDGLPIPVDVVETVNTQGANSIYRTPAGGHLLVSRSFSGEAALEVVFHEASHLLMRPGDPVQRALAAAAADVEMLMPGDLWHVVLFYTTGEAVRRVLEEAGRAGYEPLVYEIFTRSGWGRYREALDAAWAPYVEGERALPEAANDLMRAIAGARS